MQPAVVLLSGGLDSATVLAVAQSQGYACHALSFDYGQRHRHELEAAARVSVALGACEHRVCPLDLRVFGGSALTSDIAVPKDRNESQMSTGIPITYVPARNTIFLSVALGWAEILGAHDLFLGVNAVDYSGYPDCRPEFITAFEQLANLATKAGVEGTRFRVHTRYRSGPVPPRASVPVHRDGRPTSAFVITPLISGCARLQCPRRAGHRS